MKKVSKKRGKNKKYGKANKFKKIINIIIWILYLLLTLLLIYNIIKLSNIENLLRIIVVIFLSIIFLIITIFNKKKRTLCTVIMIILSSVFSFVNYTFYKVYSSLDSMTTKVETKGICLVTYLKDIEDIGDISKEEIAILGKSMDSDFYQMATDILNDNKLKNELVEYEDYFQIINALLNKEIKYAFLPENYNDIYKASSGEEENTSLDFTTLHTEQKVIQTETTPEVSKMLNEPFSMLLMGTDVILDSYNADTLMVLTVNPKTLEVTMLSIPRDTYTTIACTGGKHKINSSGWYGDKCVVKTVEKYLDIDIDYYAKINFLGIVDLVNNLGGIEVDVPYALCEQNSKRQFGSHMIYVDSGVQNLDGEQALALSRNRHYWTGMCPAKYTKDGNRSDITRGQNQQLVIRAILNKLMTVRDINQFYSILDTVGKNMSTNMSRETILSFYNVGKDIVKRLNTSSADEIINVDRLTFKSYFATVYISGLELSMIVNYDESVKYVSDQMKKNLELMKKEVIKKVSFDINEDYEPAEVKFNRLSSNLTVLPNFVGKTLNEAVSYCNSKGLKYESTTTKMDSIITSQSINAKTDISTIRNKTIKFEVESITNDNLENENTDKDDDKLINDSSNNENNTTDKDNDTPKDNDDIKDNNENNEEQDSNKDDNTSTDTNKDNEQDKEDTNNNTTDDNKGNANEETTPETDNSSLENKGDNNEENVE